MILKKLRNLCALGLAGAMFCGTMFSVTAISPRDLFDAKYYAEQNPDVVAAYGDDAEALYKHYSTYGVKEGRSLSPVFDVKSYRERYSDLEAAFGDDWSAYMNHMVEHGLCEDRYTVDKNVHSLTAEQALTIYAAKINARIEKEGVEAVLGDFDTEAYKAANPDVVAAFGNDTERLIEHYLEHGIKEGRVSTEDKSKDPVVAIQKNPTVVAFVTDFSPEAIVEKAEEIKQVESENSSSDSSSSANVCAVYGSAHVFEYVKRVWDDICTEWGVNYYECECGAEIEEMIHPFHDSIAATSAVNGGMRAICNVCGKWVDADGNVYETQTPCTIYGDNHNYEMVTHSDPTCTTGGTTEYKCDCGDELEKNVNSYHGEIMMWLTEGDREYCENCGKWIDYYGNEYDSETGE